MAKGTRSNRLLYTKWWFWVLLFLATSILLGLIDILIPDFIETRLIPSLPLLLFLAFGFYWLFIRPEKKKKEAYRENVIGFIAALSIQDDGLGVYLGDVYRMVDSELVRRHKNNEPLPNYPVFALEILASYAAINHLPSLFEYCQNYRRKASRISVSFNLDPTSPQIY
jgi:hypothetical protein